jgi:AcrR family transcriptional regulator
MTTAKPRRRLDPGKRRENLLEHARRLIVERGLSACSLEEIAREAGVSKALVYKYFPDRDSVLKALVAHEYEVMPRHTGRADPDVSFALAMGRINRDSFRYLHDRGAILREILGDGPTGRALGREDRAERVRRTWYFADKVVRTYGVSPRVALIGAVFTTNVPSVAAGALRRNGFTPDEAARFWTVFVLGGWAAAAARYGVRPFSK